MNGINESLLLEQYRKAKDIDIERLLDQYGTSLAETREMFPQLTSAIAERRKTTAFPTQPLFFTATEAQQMGLGLQEGWMLKFTPTEGNGGYTSSFITPEKWEITENDLYISPTGERYSRADLQALLSMPTGGLAQLEQIEPIEPQVAKWEDGWHIEGAPTRQLTLQDLTEWGQEEYQSYQEAGGQLNVTDWVNAREYQQLQTEQVFGAVFPELDIQEVIDYMNENPEGFLADIREIGPTKDMIALLKSLEFEDKEGNIVHLTDEEIQEFFGMAIPQVTYGDVDFSKARRIAPFPQTPAWATTTTPLDTVSFPGAYGEGIWTGEAVPLKDIAYVFGGSIKQLPSQIGASILQAVQGMNGASVVNRDWADEKIAQANENLNAFAREIAAQYPNSQFLQDISQLSRNLAYSVTTMGAGNLVALPLWLAPEPTATTKIAAATTAGIVSGYISFRLTTYQITQEYLEFKNAEKIALTGEGLTLEEENKLKADFHDDAVKYGLWEAVPEGISNMLFSGILGGSFSNALTKIVGQKAAQQIASSLITRFGSKAFGIFGEELLTETITQKGQAAIEVEVGLREENITWWGAFREIAPQTTLLTLVMLGAGQAVVKTAGVIRGKTSVANVDKILNSLKNEIGEGNILYDELKQHIEEEIGKGTITEQDAKKILESELAQKLLDDMRVADEIAKRGVPEAEISQIVADLNLLREEKIWVDTFKTKGASIIHLRTGETATIIEPPQTIYPFASYEERAMHIKWADGREMVVDSNDFAPSALQKQIAEITHGKPVPEFPTPTIPTAKEPWQMNWEEYRRYRKEQEQESFEYNLSELYSNIDIPTQQLSEDALLERISRIDKFATDIETATKGIKTKFKGDWYVGNVVDDILNTIEKIRKETNPSEKTILFSNLKQTLHSAVADHPGMNEYYSNKLGVDIWHLFTSASEGAEGYTAIFPTAEAGMAEVTIPKDIQGVINKIRTLDKKQRELQTTADQILSTSPYGQAPPVYGTTLDKAIKVTEQKAELWNGIRDKVIKTTGKTLWQTAIERNLPVVNFDKEKHLDFFAEDIEGLFQPKIPTTPTGMPEVTEGETIAGKSLWEMTDDELLQVVDLDIRSRVIRFPKGGKIVSTYPKELNYKEGLDIFRQTAKREGLAITPISEVGMPEAGVQPPLIEGVPAKEVRPQPTGKLVQARIDDYLRLRDYNKQAVADRIEALKKALETKGRSELGLKGNLRLELARLEALQELDAVEILEELDRLIREVETELGRRSLPGQGEPARKGIDLARHPRKPNVFPEYTSRQLEEMLNVYNQARQKMAGEVPALAPAPKAEPTTAELNRVKTDPTPASDEVILRKFIDCIKDAKPAREVTEVLKHEELSRRAAVFASILQGGQGAKAFERAKGALKGFLPRAEYILDLQKFGITDAEIERMFDKIRLDTRWHPFRKLNTYEAFANLMMGGIPTEGQLLLLERQFGSELAKVVLDKMSTTSEKAVRIALDIANIPRTLKTIVDLSATLRQGAVLAFGQPVQFAQAFKEELRVVFSEKNFKLINEIVHNNVYAEQAERYGLYIAPIEEAVKLEAREEAFRGRLIEKVPIVGSVVRASERAYITFLNVLRMETWAYYCKQWEGTNKSVKDYTDLASFINHATGRGDLGALSRAGSYLSAVFFSPRYVMSRVQLPLDLVKSTPAVRKIAARNLVSWVGANLLVIMLLKLAGADVEDDPRSSDFGKVRFGNTRIDFWAGFQPYVRVITQIITEERKSTRTGETYEIDPIDVGVNFVRSKLAPIPGLLWSLKSGKTFIGEELTAENAESIIYQELTPLAVQDWIDAVKWSNEGASTLYGILSMLGVGVQTWSNNWDTAQEQLGLPVRSETAPYTIENDVYDMKDYYSEVGRMIGGATYEMLAERGDIPELVLMVARAKDAKNTISLLPNQRLTSINADLDEGDTFEQYHAQWLARQDITDEGEMAKFDELYPKAHLGNMTQSQYALLVEYHSLSPDAQAAFLGKHPGLYANPREAWLKSHPEENAILALMGQSNVYSLEALDKVSSLANSLDIPENAQVMTDLDEVTKLKLKNQTLFDLLDAYSGLDDEVKDTEGLTDRDRAIQSLYESNPDFRDDMRRIEALNVGTEKNPTLDSIVEGWVERGQLVDDFGASSAEAKLWLIDNKEVHQWALENGILTDTGEDWNENILRLNVAYREDFDLYASYGDRTSDNYIEGDIARANARKDLLFDDKGKITSFGTAYYTKQALEKDFPQNLIEDYIGWYSGNWGSGYEDDWFLMSHMDFYNTMLSMGIWTEPRDFTKVPTREVYALYQQYLDLPSGNPRLDFRSKHPDLDAWLVLAFGYKPVEERGQPEAKKTPWEEAAEVKQFQEAFR